MDKLFERPGRALSHGCVRLEQPDELAAYVLRDSPEWPPERMKAAMASGVETPVKLKAPITVHIAYFTSSVDENGGRHFYPDTYGYDRVQAQK
jgi:Uncharacterized protein conserved in bacteria